MKTERKSHSMWWVALCLGFVLDSSASSARETRFLAPRNANVEWVSNAVSWNGIELGIRKFETKDRIEKVADFYKRRWAEGEDGLPGYREAYAAPWLILSKLDDDILLAVQVQAKLDGGSWGYLSTSDLPVLARGDRPSRVAPLAFPVMRGSRVLDESVSRDPGKKGRVVSIANDFSVDGNITFYRDYYEGSGWAGQADQSYGPGHALTYSHEGKQVHIVIHRVGSGSSVVANEVEISR